MIMMAISVYLLLLIHTQATVVFLVGNSQQNVTFPSLDTAFQAIQDISEAQIRLLPSLEAFPIKFEGKIAHFVTIIGEGQEIRLETALLVDSNASLRLVNATIWTVFPFPKDHAMAVFGSIELFQTNLSGFTATGILLYGACRLINVHIANNSVETILLRSGKASLMVLNTTVTTLSASFLSFRLTDYEKIAGNIVISNSNFEDNCVEGVPLLDLRNMQGFVRIKGSKFSGNVGISVEMQGNGLLFEASHCVFEENHGSLFASVMLSNSSISLSNCTFLSNSEVSVQLLGFAGNFSFEDSTIRQQHGKGPIRVENLQQDNANCYTFMRNSSFADFNITVTDYSRSSMLFFLNCTVLISHISITNAAVLSVFTYRKEGIIAAEFSTLSIDNLSLRDSGGTGYIVGVFIGHLIMTDFVLNNPYSGQEIYIISVGGTAVLRKGVITGGSGYTFNLDKPIVYELSYFGCIGGQVDMQDILIRDSQRIMGLGFANFMTNLSLRNIRVFNMNMGAPLIASYCKGIISGFIVENILCNMHMIQGVGSDISVLDVQVKNIEAGMLFGAMDWSRSTIRYSNLTITDSKVREIFTFHRSISNGTDILVERCMLNAVFRAENSDITFLHFRGENITGRFILLMNCTLAISHSHFLSFSSHLSLIDSIISHISLTDVQILNFTTNSQFGNFRPGSSWIIQQSLFSGLNSMLQTGFQLSESVLLIRESIFRYFDFGLFQCQASNITVTKMRVNHGKNPVRSLRSREAFGGAFSCIDCPQVILREAEFFNISAAVGGAVSVKRLSSAGELTLIVEQSSFVLCSAVQAGALFIQNTTFWISDCQFDLNAAEQAGGALFAAIKPWQQGFIRHTLFSRNSAHEGGGFKFSNAEIALFNVSFMKNTAIYGPDKASYGVKLSPRLTNVTGDEASGYPITLIFELQDHYGQRVNVSPYKYLMMSPTSQVSYQGNNITLLKQGLFTFSGTTIFALPGSVQVIEAAINDTQEDFSLNLIGRIPIVFRNCTPGEISHTDRCEYCNAGNFSFSPNDTKCAFCPAHAFCPGGNELLVDAHYWRSALNSSQIYACPLPNKCLGGGNSTCAAGHAGPLCRLCAEGHTPIRSVDCVDCTGMLAIQICGILLILSAFIWALLRFAVSKPNADKLSTLKAVINHFQLMSVLCFLRVSYSRVITWELHAITYFSSLSIVDFPLSCVGITAPIYGKAIIGSLFYPAYLLFSTLICLLFTSSWKLKSLICATSGLLYTPVVAVVTAFPLLACQAVTTTQEYLFYDMSIPCWTQSHQAYIYTLALPSLLLNIGLPVCITLAINLFNPPAYQRYFPLWTAGYIYSLCDLYVLFFTCLLLSVMIVSSPPLVQVTYSLSILITDSVIMTCLSKVVFPSAERFALRICSLVAVATTLGFSSYYLVYSAGNSGGSGYFVDIVMIGINGAYILLCTRGLGYRKIRAIILKSSILAPPNTPRNTI